MNARASFPLVVLAFALVACGGTDLPSGPSQANPPDAEESSVVFSLNQLRGTSGITQVTVCTSLDVSASKHSDDMRDKMYLSDMSPDGTTARQRACDASYTPACTGDLAMAELVASGNATGKDTFLQWVNDKQSNPILMNPNLTV